MSSSSKSSSSSSSIYYTLIFDNWWGNKSVFIQPQSSFGKLKHLFIQRLLAQKIIDNEDLDTRNQIAHVALIGKKDVSKSEKTRVYDQHNKQDYLLSMDMINIKDNFVEVGFFGRFHMTLVYKKDIGIYKDFIVQLLNELIPLCGEKDLKSTTLPQEEDEDDSKDNTQLCVVCLDKDKQVVIKPCMHLCTCGGCALRLEVCPICRGSITSTERIYMS
jgi:hypothetical protein